MSEADTDRAFVPKTADAVAYVQVMPAPVPSNIKEFVAGVTDVLVIGPEPISDRLPGIDVEAMKVEAWQKATLPDGEDAPIHLIRLAVLAERRRVLARLDELIRQCPEGAGSERTYLLMFRSCLTHAGITPEEAIDAALSRCTRRHLEPDQPITIEAP